MKKILFHRILLLTASFVTIKLKLTEPFSRVFAIAHISVVPHKHMAGKLTKFSVGEKLMHPRIRWVARLRRIH